MGRSQGNARGMLSRLFKTFYHVMNDFCSQVEHHPLVVHLPAPDICLSIKLQVEIPPSLHSKLAVRY